METFHLRNSGETSQKGVESRVRKKTSDSEPPTSRRKPATTSEGRESQLISMAEDLAEKQLLDGTASAQVISHYLKLGSSREKLEQQRISHENDLMRVKIQVMEERNRIEELYMGAINAMRSYTGQDPIVVSEEYEN